MYIKGIIEKLGIGYEESKATITCNSALAKELLGDLQEDHIPVENKAMLICKEHVTELLENEIFNLQALEWVYGNASDLGMFGMVIRSRIGHTKEGILRACPGKTWEDIEHVLDEECKRY